MGATSSSSFRLPNVPSRLTLDRITLLGITVDFEALASIARFAGESRDGLETGGILVGHESADGTIKISSAGDAGPKALRESRRFLRDLDHAQALAAVAFEASRAQWVGEWHTHPSGQIEPSQLDLDTYIHHLVDPDLEFNSFASVVVTPCDPEWRSVSAWIWVCEAQSVSLRGAIEGLRSIER